MREMALYITVIGLIVAIVLSATTIVVRTRALDNLIEADGLGGHTLIGLAVYDGSKWHNMTAYSPKLFEYAVYYIGSISVTDPTEVKIYAVIKLDYYCSGIKSLRAKVSLRQWYEEFMNIESLYGSATRDLPSTNGSHSVTITVFLGTLDYIAWLSNYASGKTRVYPYPGSWEPISSYPPQCVDIYYLRWDGTLRITGTTIDGKPIDVTKNIHIEAGTASADFCKDTLSIAYSLKVSYATDSLSMSFIRLSKMLGT